MALKTLQNFYKTTVATAWATGTGNRYVTTLPTPSAGYLVINPANASKREIVTYTAKGTDGGGNYITVSARGVGGTTDQTHAVGEAVRLNFTAQHYSDIQTELDLKLDDSDLDTDGTLAANSDSKIATQKATKTYADAIQANVNGKVSLTGDETVAGIKTFSSSPVVPTGGTGTQAANHTDIANAVTGASGTATNSVAGTVKLSVAAASTPNPIAVGDNDPRVPTADPTTLFLPLLTGLVLPYAGTSAPSGWLICNGDAVSRATYSTLFALVGTTFGAGDGSTTFNIPDLRGRVINGAGTGTKVATFASRSGNVITVTGLSNVANNEFQTGQAVLYSAPSGAMTGLTHNTTYYIVRTGNITFSLATSLANAQNGTVISLSSDGTGTQTFTLTLTARTLGDTGGEENHAMSSSELLSHRHTYETYTATGGGTGAYYGTNGGLVTTPNTSLTGGNSAMNNMQPFLVLNYVIKY